MIRVLGFRFQVSAFISCWHSCLSIGLNAFTARNTEIKLATRIYADETKEQELFT